MATSFVVRGQDAYAICEQFDNFKEFAITTIQSHEQHPDRIESYLKELSVRASASGDCKCHEFAIALGIQLKLFGEAQVASFLDQCEVSDGNFSFALGTLAFDKQEFQSALQFFKHAIENGAEPAICHFNMASCHIGLNQLNEAMNCLEEGTGHLSEHSSRRMPQIITLQAIYLRIFEWDLALKWVDEFEKLSSIKGDYGSAGWIEGTARYKTINQLNKLLGHVGLKDTAFVRANWSDIDWNNPELATFNTLQSIQTIAPLLESSLIIREAENTMNLAFLTLDFEQDQMARLGTFSLLHPSLRDSLFNGANSNEIWVWLHGLERQVLNDGVIKQDSSAGIPPLSAHSIWLSYIALAVANFLLLFMLFKSLKIIRMKSKQLSDHFQLVSMYLLEGKGDKSSAYYSFNAIHSISESAIDKFMRENGIHLSSKEQLLLASYRLKLSPKEIAKKYSWSPGYVYNISSELRAKLNLKPSESFQDWLDKKIPES